MTPSEYEDYVAKLVASLSFSSFGKVYRSKTFKGVRQPGEYEIDVALEITVEDALRFLVIVECKNWLRPVDRPVVQKLAQTRDAISAHKAAIASPIGFTAEAKAVGKAQGIALWVISEFEWEVVSGGGFLAPDPHFFELCTMRRRLLDWIRVKHAEIGCYALMNVAAAEWRPEKGRFYHKAEVLKSSFDRVGLSEVVMHPDMAVVDILDSIGASVALGHPELVERLGLLPLKAPNKAPQVDG